MDRESHRKFLPLLADAGLAPKIIRLNDTERCLERCQTFSEWRRYSNDDQLRRMGLDVLELFRAVHALDICHRDLHEGNLLVKDDRPLVIDLEHAVEVDPTWPCYDLYGPSDQVPILPDHQKAGGILGTTGIWWDAEFDQRFGLITVDMIFGPLVDLEASI